MQKREGRIWGHGHVGEKERLLHGAARTCQRGGWFPRIQKHKFTQSINKKVKSQIPIIVS